MASFHPKSIYPNGGCVVENRYVISVLNISLRQLNYTEYNFRVNIHCTIRYIKSKLLATYAVITCFEKIIEYDSLEQQTANKIILK